MGFGGGYKGGSGKVGTDQEVSGTIHISEEQSSTPDAPTDSGGILYVKSADPTKVYYRGKGGSEVDLTEPGGGGGGGITLNPAGAENQLLTRHANANTASAEANLTFDGGTNVLTVTGQVTASVGLSGAVGQFGSAFVQGQSIVGHYATGSDLDSKQPLDATLTALAGVSVAADKLIYATNTDTFTTTDFTTFGRNLVDDADASAARGTLGLGTMAQAATSDYAALAGATFGGAVKGTSFSGSSTLQAVGATTLGSTLGVTGAATFQDTTSIFTSNALTSTPGAAFTIEAKSHGDLNQDDNLQALFRDTTENGFVRIGFQSRETGASSYDLSKTWLIAARGRAGATNSYYNFYYQELGASPLSLRGDGQATFYKNIIVGDGVTGGISGSGGLEIVGNSILGGNLSVSGNVGIGTSSPQHKLDVPSMGGMVLADTHVTGARDGSGNVVFIAGRTTNAGNGFRDTSNWKVSHEVGHSDSQLTVSFVMPASGRVQVSFEGNLWHYGQGMDAEKYVASDAEFEAALTASGNQYAGYSTRQNDSIWFFSLSTSDTSYVPAGPRDEFERMVQMDEDAGTQQHTPVFPGKWVMTGTAGTSHTVSLAWAYFNMHNGTWANGHGQYNNYVQFLMYGGSGITNTAQPIFGPVGLKVISLPSAS